LRPRDEPGRIRRQLAMDHLSDVRSLDRRIKAVGAQITDVVATTGTTLIGVFGVGPVLAARILAEVGDAARFPDKDHFASYNGTAPIDASSGEQQRHRLSRAGNRRINHALHMAAVTQLRNPPAPAAPTTNANSLPARPAKKHSAASNDASPTSCSANSSSTYNEPRQPRTPTRLDRVEPIRAAL
jgi:transposase